MADWKERQNKLKTGEITEEEASRLEGELPADVCNIYNIMCLNVIQFSSFQLMC